MTAREMWQAYLQLCPEAADCDYEAWSYGDDADTLAKLTLDGIKTATASAYPLYEWEGETLPRAGEYGVILWADGSAACIIRTDRVYVTPFAQVTPEQAWREGEGDRSLDYWRQIHERFFTGEMEAAGLRFTPQMDVVCEEFRRVFPVL